jgi:hypothetical protein
MFLPDLRCLRARCFTRSLFAAAAPFLPPADAASADDDYFHAASMPLRRDYYFIFATSSDTPLFSSTYQLMPSFQPDDLPLMSAIFFHFPPDYATPLSLFHFHYFNISTRRRHYRQLPFSPYCCHAVSMPLFSLTCRHYAIFAFIDISFSISLNFIISLSLTFSLFSSFAFIDITLSLRHCYFLR